MEDTINEEVVAKENKSSKPKQPKDNSTKKTRVFLTEPNPEGCPKIR